MTGWPITPRPDADSAPFWAALAESRLVVRQCRTCDHLWLPPRGICPRCGSQDLDWSQVSGAATVIAVTEVVRGLGEGFAGRVPYVLAVVRLHEGPQLMATLTAPAAIGDDVVFERQATDDGGWLATFTPISL